MRAVPRPVCVFAAACLVGALAAGLDGCGARSELVGTTGTVVADGGVPGVDAEVSDACAVAPLCVDDTRGTWRLEGVAGETVGYLFTFDGRPSCNGSSTSFLLVLGAADAACSRNGDAELTESGGAALAFTSSGMGGSFGPACGGGDPNRESLRVALERVGCDPVSYRLTATDSAAGSMFSLATSAVRCRCDIGWAPCQAPLPTDPCAP